MADDKSKRGAADRARVAGGESYEVAYVAGKTGKTTAQVKAAASKAGPARKKVEEALKKR